MKFSKERDFYNKIKNKRGFDNLDEAVLYDFLKYEGEGADKENAVVQDCAARVLSQLQHNNIEPSTDIAFGCYVAALHQLYLAGMAMELKNLGYKMTLFTPNLN